jgi:hypothetical protein
MPRLAWSFYPAADADSAAALAALGVRSAFLHYQPMSALPDGSVAMILNRRWFYLVSPAAEFLWVGGVGSSAGDSTQAPIATDQDWLTEHSVTALVSANPSMGPSATVTNWLEDYDLAERPARYGQRLPAVVKQDGTAYWPGGSNWVVSTCAMSPGLRWILELDIGSLEAASVVGIDGAAPRMVLADGDELIVTVGTPEWYVVSTTGVVRETASAPEGSPAVSRHLLGWVRGCGTFVVTSDDVELWPSPRERAASWSRFCGSSRSSYCIDHRFVSPAADCGILAFVESVTGSGGTYSVRHFASDGSERWRVGVAQLTAAPVPLEDGGTLLFTEAELIRLDSMGEERWRWPVPVELGSIVSRTPVLTSGGRAYFAADRDAGVYSVVAVDVGVAPGPMAWFESGANPGRTGTVP